MDKKLNNNVLILGATGLVGSELLALCCGDITIGKVNVITRSELKFSSPKLVIHKFDFENFNSLSQLFSDIDIVFCCLGTTMKKAGSKDAFRRVDYDIPVKIAKIAKTVGVERFIAISSIGADENSSNFYLKTKGEMEKEILALNFLKVALLRPSFLAGKRNEFRTGEKIALIFMFLFKFLFVGRFAKYKPIDAEVVANAMIKISMGAANTKIYESNEIQWIGK